MYRIDKVWESSAQDLKKVRCVKYVDDIVLVEEGHIRKSWQSYFYKLLNRGWYTSIVIGDLEHYKRFNDDFYCKCIKVKEINEGYS